VNWEAVGAIAEFLGALGVIASLIYVGMQIRESSRVVQASTSQAVADSAQARLLAVAQSLSLASALAKLVDTPTAASSAEQIQVKFLRTASFKGFENQFFQYRQGLLGADTWSGYEFFLLANLRAPDVQQWWSRSKDGFAAACRSHVEGLLAKLAAQQGAATNEPQRLPIGRW
jgi:hypothetical protein